MTEKQARRLAWSAFGLWVLFLLARSPSISPPNPCRGREPNPTCCFP